MIATDDNFFAGVLTGRLWRSFLRTLVVYKTAPKNSSSVGAAVRNSNSSINNNIMLRTAAPTPEGFFGPFSPYLQ